MIPNSVIQKIGEIETKKFQAKIEKETRNSIKIIFGKGPAHMYFHNKSFSFAKKGTTFLKSYSEHKYVSPRMLCANVLAILKLALFFIRLKSL